MYTNKRMQHMKFLLFDLDETIFDFKQAEAAAVKKTLGQLSLPATDEVAQRYSVINKSQWERLERGEITREQVLVGRFGMLFEELEVSADPARAREIYEGYLSQGHYFVPGAEELLEELYGRYQMYLVSNGTAKVQEGRLKSAGISRYFQEIFISQEVGYNKPDVRFFEYCFGRIPGFRREEAMMIGDSLTSDMQGGRNGGIATCWFNPEGKPCTMEWQPDYEIRALAQLPELLERIDKLGS